MAATSAALQVDGRKEGSPPRSNLIMVAQSQPVRLRSSSSRDLAHLRTAKPVTKLRPRETRDEIKMAVRVLLRPAKYEMQSY